MVKCIGLFLAGQQCWDQIFENMFYNVVMFSLNCSILLTFNQCTHLLPFVPLFDILHLLPPLGSCQMIYLSWGLVSKMWLTIELCGMVCLGDGRKSIRTGEKSLVNIVSCFIDFIQFLKFCFFLCYISSNVYIG